MKEREERYQTAREMLTDLKRLKQRQEFEAERERLIPPGVQTAAPEARPSGQMAVAPVTAPVASSTELGAVPNASPPKSGIKRHRIMAALAAAALILAVAAGVSYFYFARSPNDAIDSIAVLPLVNASADPDTEYLSDGLTESLINSLSQLQNLRVVARSTVFRYKGKESDSPKAGRELGVRAVLTGRVQQRGDTLTIQAELVDVTNGSQLWGEQYERKISDLLAVKQDISKEIVEKLRMKLSGSEQQRMAKRETGNTEAYQLYLKGRYYWNKRTAEGFNKAIEQFQQAVEKDPNYALAYVGLADCYVVLEEYAGTPASEVNPKARAYAERALQVDASLAEAHASLAFINYRSWKFGEAETEFKRAISLNPNYPTAHHWYNVHLRTVGRLDEALAESKRAQELDPLSPVISLNVAQNYLLKGDLDAAVDQLRTIIELDPNYPGAYAYLGYAYIRQGRFPEAIREFQKAADFSGRASNYLGNLGYGYAMAGKHAEARTVVKELEARYAKREGLGFDIAVVHVGLKDNDQAFAWLEKDFRSRSGVLPSISGEPVFDSLLSDPRYADLLRRMGIRN